MGSISRVVLLLLVGLSLPVCHQVTAASPRDNIFVGCLIELGTHAGYNVLSALEITVKSINLDPSLLPDYQLSLLVMNSSAHDPLQAQAAAVDLLLRKPVAIIGPSSSLLVSSTVFLTDATQTPMITYGATDPSLTDGQPNPYLLRMSYNDGIQMDAVTDVVRFYGWKRLLLIHSQNDWGRGGASQLLKVAGDKGLIVDATLPIDLSFTPAQVAEALLAIQDMDTSVIVLHVERQQVELVLNAAKQFGLFASGYVWVATAPTIAHFSSLPFTSTFLSDFEGIIGTAPIVTPSRLMQKSFPTWLDQVNNAFGYVEGLYASDSLRLVAHAIQNYSTAVKHAGGAKSQADEVFLSTSTLFPFTPLNPSLPTIGGRGTDLGKLHVNQGGPHLLRALQNASFEGITGPVYFTPSGDLVNQTFVIVNVLQQVVRNLGFWTPGFGFSNSLPPVPVTNTSGNSTSGGNSSVLAAVVWPGRSTQLPTGFMQKNTKPLLIAVPRKQGYKQFVSISETTNATATNDKFTGFCIDVFKAAIQLLPNPPPYQFVAFGDKVLGANYSDMVVAVANQSFDAAVGDITITSKRLAMVDFTQPYQASGLSLVVPQQKYQPDPWAFLKPFSPSMWILIYFSFFYTALVVWFLEHLQNEEFGGKLHRQLAASVWFSFSTMVFIQEAELRTTLGRLAVTVWVFLVFIISSSYTASLTSFLTVYEVKPTVLGFNDLIAKNMTIGIQSGSFSQAYLIQLGLSPSQLLSIGSEQAFDGNLTSNNIQAVVDEDPYLQIFMTDFCGYTEAKRAFAPFNFGFAFQKGSPLVHDVSVAIQQLAQSGRLQGLHDLWLRGTGSCSNTITVQSNKLGPDAFWGLFVLYGVAAVGACLVYAGLLIFRGYKALSSEDLGGSGRSHGKSLRDITRAYSAGREWSIEHNIGQKYSYREEPSIQEPQSARFSLPRINSDGTIVPKDDLQAEEASESYQKGVLTASDPPLKGTMSGHQSKRLYNVDT